MNQLLTFGIVFISSVFGGSNDECCQLKMVGLHQYHYVETGDTENFNCISKCIYTRVGLPSSRFCFKSGNQEVFCHYNVDGVSAGGSEGGVEGPVPGACTSNYHDFHGCELDTSTCNTAADFLPIFGWNYGKAECCCHCSNGQVS